MATVAADAAAVFDQSGFPVEALEEHVPGGPPMLTAAWGTLGNFLIAGQIHEALQNQRQDMTHSFAEALERSWKMTPETFGAAARERGRLNLWCGDVFDRFDLLLTPTVPYDPPPARGPFPTHTEGQEQVPAGVAAFTIPFNMSGHPAATVRAGLSDAGLPIGLQIVGPRHRDDLVMRAARLFERTRTGQSSDDSGARPQGTTVTLTAPLRLSPAISKARSNSSSGTWWVSRPEYASPLAARTRTDSAKSASPGRRA